MALYAHQLYQQELAIALGMSAGQLSGGAVEKSQPAPFGFDYVERKLRSKTFGILSTVSQDVRPHSVGVVYGVSPPGKPFCLYLITRPVLKKARNIAQNPNISFVVPFPYFVLRPFPQSCIQFQAKAEIVPIDNSDATRAYERSVVLRRSKEHSLRLGESIFIKVVPDEKIFSFGISASALQFLVPSQNRSLGNFYVTIPQGRRFG